jgi:hypothetical protein
VNASRISWKWIRRGLVAVAIVAFFMFRGDLPHVDLENAIEDLSRGWCMDLPVGQRARLLGRRVRRIDRAG